MVLVQNGASLTLPWDVTTVEMQTAEAAEVNVSGWRNPNFVSPLQVNHIYLGILTLQ